MRLWIIGAAGAAVLATGCANSKSTVAVTRKEPFPLDAPRAPLNDHCSDPVVADACPKVQALKASRTALDRLHEGQMVAWAGAVNRLRLALAAGFKDPAVAVELKAPLLESWQSPDYVSQFPAVVRLESESGLERSAGREALVEALDALAVLSAKNNKDWTDFLAGPGRGLAVPQSIIAARVPYTLTLNWQGATKVVALPSSLVEPLRGAVTNRWLVVSLVATEGEIKHRDLASQVVPMPPAFAVELEETAGSISEASAARKRVPVDGLSAPIEASCQSLRVELRFVDEGESPPRRFSVRPLAARSNP